MPNWVNNTIAIKKENMKYLINKDGNVDFNIICPMPEELSKTISGGTINECIAYYVFVTSKTKKEFFRRLDDERKIIGRTRLDLKPCMKKKDIKAMILNRIGENVRMFNDEFTDGKAKSHTPLEVGEWYYNIRKKYGASDWYEWSYANWGCKWNASETRISEDGDLLCVSFDTPWGPPVEFLEQLSKKCPFYLEWVEEQGYHGEIMFNGVDFLDSDLPEMSWEEIEDGCYEEVGDYYFDDRKEDVLTWKLSA